MFTLPLEQKKPGGPWTWRCLVALSLVIITLILKGVLLWAIFRAVVMKDLAWQQSIMKTEAPSILTERPSNSAAFLALGATQPTCNTGGSLCSEHNGTFSCAPPSVQLTGRWNELDTNGDGVWTREEVMNQRDALKCKYVVDPLEVFEIFIKFILKREKHLWIHPDLRAGRAIHKAYFKFASGDLIMCGYRNEKMCPNLFKRGVFDAALKEGSAPRVGTTIDSALDYCYELLQEGGTCERTLPSTYSVWKTYSDKQCWGPAYDKYVYTHPTSGNVKSMLTVDYKAPKAYSRAADSGLFRAYKGIIIGLFLLAMYAELKDVSLQWTWVRRYPAAEDRSGDEVVEVNIDGKTAFRIQAISRQHRFVMGTIVIIRFIIVVCLVSVGVSFLMRDTSWVELLLNGLALVFVTDVANNIFTHVLDSHLQDQFLQTEPMFIEMEGIHWLNRRPAVRDMIGFGTLCILMFVIMAVHLHWVGVPISEAVECACTSSGSNCREASAFDSGFWTKYWTQDVPGVYHTVDKLKASLGTMPITEADMGATVAHKQRRKTEDSSSKDATTVAEEKELETKEARPAKVRSAKDEDAYWNPDKKGGVRWHIIVARNKNIRNKKARKQQMLNKAHSSRAA